MHLTLNGDGMNMDNVTMIKISSVCTSNIDHNHSFTYLGLTPAPRFTSERGAR